MYQTLDVASGEKLIIPPTFMADGEKYLQGALAIVFLFLSGLWNVKISFLLFFRRLGNKVSGHKLHWWLVLSFTLATYAISIGTIQFHCFIRPFQEIIPSCSSKKAISFERVTLCINSAMDVLTDVTSKLPSAEFSCQYILFNPK